PRPVTSYAVGDVEKRLSGVLLPSCEIWRQPCGRRFGGLGESVEILFTPFCEPFQDSGGCGCNLVSGKAPGQLRWFLTMQRYGDASLGQGAWKAIVASESLGIKEI